ncbi:putative F-box/kelch-repeat protein [Raphanus sativus]|uniref:F-box/kelch-repeat protein At3g17540 n=1 Tax=Raphanus sativus TaxID=3726 RepID=A0A9W3CBY9_RAPSA|nr:putative F-box/kelch-repeat protein At3g17540 [Raphanus sativus]KAJ4882074.1 putative F-box/kelch-repeat protein [Raphanus sativus]
MKFDFTAERFARLPLPFQSDDVSEDNVLLSAVRDEKLAVSRALVGSDVVRIWITNKIDKEAKDLLSWRTDFVLEVDCAKYNVTMENFLLDEENKVVVCCGKYSEDGHVTMIYIVGGDMFKQVYLYRCSYPYNWPLLITYVPSLVRIP